MYHGWRYNPAIFFLVLFLTVFPDPEQLPPTVLSQQAMKWGYDRSLFVRLHKNSPEAIHLLRFARTSCSIVPGLTSCFFLSIQYRMHPDISCVPSKIFYNGRLHDGPDMAKKTEQPWHAEPKLGVYKFFSVSRVEKKCRLWGILNSIVKRLMS